jgi:hypothetical protein
MGNSMSVLSSLKERVNSHATLVHRGRWVSLDFTLGVGETDYLVSVLRGEVSDVRERRLQTQSGKFSIRASRESWDLHWSLIPPRDYHDVFAMLAKGLVKIDGNLVPLMQNLQYFKDLIGCLRQGEGVHDAG